MRSNIDFKLRLQFDNDAALYDKARPKYPQGIFDIIADQATLTSGSHILEVGCGTGQATVNLAKSGYQVTALEPGKNLAAIARLNCASFNKVSVLNQFFENFDAPISTFDAIISANAWHWVPSNISYSKASQLLKKGGSLVVFWNYPEIEDKKISDEIEKIVDRVAPEANGLSCYHGLSKKVEILLEQGLEEFRNNGYFRDISTHTIPSMLVMDPISFPEWVSTYSNIQALSISNQRDLQSALSEYIAKLEGQQIYLTNTHIMRIGKNAHPETVPKFGQ